MSQPKFEVHYDRSARLLSWTMRGFWTLADVGAFAGALRAATAPLGAPPYRFDGLADAREFPIQSVEVSRALGAVDEAARTMGTGRVAIVVGSVMNKMQAQRTLSDCVRIFPSMDEAKAWLAETSVEAR